MPQFWQLCLVFRNKGLRFPSILLDGPEDKGIFFMFSLLPGFTSIAFSHFVTQHKLKQT